MRYFYNGLVLCYTRNKCHIDDEENWKRAASSKVGRGRIDVKMWIQTWEICAARRQNEWNSSLNSSQQRIVVNSKWIYRIYYWKIIKKPRTINNIAISMNKPKRQRNIHTHATLRGKSSKNRLMSKPQRGNPQRWEATRANTQTGGRNKRKRTEQQIW